MNAVNAEVVKTLEPAKFPEAWFIQLLLDYDDRVIFPCETQAEAEWKCNDILKSGKRARIIRIPAE